MYCTNCVNSFFANPFHREIFNEEESIEDLWPFVRHNSRERLPSNGNSGLNERDTEPIGKDIYIKLPYPVLFVVNRFMHYFI